MLTHLVHHNYYVAAASLDKSRLMLQRTEVYTILQAIIDPNHFSRDELVVRMWAPWRNALVRYGMAISLECHLRRKSDTDNLMMKITALHDPSLNDDEPDWFYDDKLYASHRSHLLKEFPEYYSRFYWDEPDDLPYYWPAQAYIPIPEQETA